MIFNTSVRRDLNGVAGVMFATLFTIMVTTTLTRFIGRAATDVIASADVLPLIAFTSIGFIPVLLVLTVFLSILVVLSRAWRDSEMVVWFASGQSLTAWLRPVYGFVLPYAIVVALISLVVSPWAYRQIDELRRQFERREDVSQVAPGKFRESRGSNRVFFVESVSKDLTEVRNVFVAQKDGDRVVIVASAGGKVESEPSGDRFVVLEKGRRYDGTWGMANWSLMAFDRYGVRLEPESLAMVPPQNKGMPTLDLLRAPDAARYAELMQRLSWPLSLLVVAALAIPLSFVNPRIGSSLNLVIGVLIYFTYTNVNGLMKTWIQQQRIEFGIGVWLPHVVLLAVVVWLFHRRMSLPRMSFGRLLARLRGGGRRAADEPSGASA